MITDRELTKLKTDFGNENTRLSEKIRHLQVECECLQTQLQKQVEYERAIMEPEFEEKYKALYTENIKISQKENQILQHRINVLEQERQQNRSSKREKFNKWKLLVLLLKMKSEFQCTTHPESYELNVPQLIKNYMELQGEEMVPITQKMMDEKNIDLVQKHRENLGLVNQINYLENRFSLIVQENT